MKVHQQIEAISMSAAAAMVVAMAELIGVLETILATTTRTRQVALAQDLFIDAEQTQHLGPTTGCAAFQFIDPRFEVNLVHGCLPYWQDSQSGFPTEHVCPLG